MFGHDFIARGLDEDQPCQFPNEQGDLCGQPASLAAPLGSVMIPCCSTHFGQVLAGYRRSKKNYRQFTNTMRLRTQAVPDVQSTEPTTEPIAITIPVQRILFPSSSSYAILPQEQQEAMQEEEGGSDIMTMEKKPEHPSTYMVQDRSNEDEVKRLQSQDPMLIEIMGGVLPEQEGSPSCFQRVIDVGCGAGGWLIALAHALPEADILAGIDVSLRMIESCRTLASEQGISHRVEFHVMDALRMIEFPHNYFDLVNQRIGLSYLRTWDWPNLLQEYQRIARPGGIIRITEPNVLIESNSAALNQVAEYGLQAFYNAGHLFFPGRNGVIDELPKLLRQHGLADVRQRDVVVSYATEEGMVGPLVDDIRLIFKNMLPFLRKWTKLPDTYDQLYQQAVLDMSMPGFRAWYTMRTVWGTNKENSNHIPQVEHR